MAFLKVDCGILDSSLWSDVEARDVFLTALLMAVPYYLKAETPQIEVGKLRPTGWMVPPGDYGFIRASGTAIVNKSGVELEAGLKALERLGSEDHDSRSLEFGGRRLVRVEGGYIALNYDRYREKDYGAAERMKRYREKIKNRNSDATLRATTPNVTPRTPHVTQAEAEAEGEVQREITSLSPPLPLHAKSPKEPPPRIVLNTPMGETMAEIEALHKVWQERTGDSCNVRAYERDWLEFLDHRHVLADIELVIEHTKVWNRNHKPRYARKLTLRRTIGDLAAFGDRLAEAKEWEAAGRPLDGSAEAPPAKDFSDQGDSL